MIRFTRHQLRLFIITMFFICLIVLTWNLIYNPYVNFIFHHEKETEGTESTESIVEPGIINETDLPVQADGTEVNGMGTAPYEPSGTLTVTYVDVGQGDCTVITQGDESMMIDTGYWFKQEECESALYEKGISQLKYLVLTHPDADHIGNADALVRDFAVDTVILPNIDSDKDVYRIDMDAFETYNIPIQRVQAGDTLTLGDAVLHIFGPVTIPEEPEDMNNASVMIKLEFGRTGFLFIGDAEVEEEEEAVEWAAENGIDLHADVLKCGHHGSWNSMYLPLYEAAGADTYIISCGTDNEYGHPSDKVLQYIEERGGNIYLTQSRNGIEGKGNIMAVSDGQSVEWTTFN